MTTPTLVIVARSISTVRFLFCAASGAELHILEEDPAEKFALKKIIAAVTNGQSCELVPGTYVLVGSKTRGIGCEVIKGSVAVIFPTEGGGEDPWPDPARRVFQGGQDPFPVPDSPSPLMPSDVREYAQAMMKRP